MDSPPNKRKLNKGTFSPLAGRVSWNPNLAELRQSEREAYECILEFLGQEQVFDVDKLKFLRAVDTMSGVVRAQANGNMDDYFPQTVLAKKIETLILEESSEALVSTVRLQAMLCIAALSQVNPPLHLSQKLDLAKAGLSSIISLPPIAPSLDRKDSASLYIQTMQALDDMLQALVLERLEPSMATLQSFLEIILPCLIQSEKVHEQSRALGAISRLLRFICNFPELSHMAEFSISGQLMGTLGLFCVNPNQEISMGASEALHYLFKVLVLHRSKKHKTENILKDLQRHFRAEWFANLQDLAMPWPLSHHFLHSSQRIIVKLQIASPYRPSVSAPTPHCSHTEVQLHAASEARLIGSGFDSSRAPFPPAQVSLAGQTRQPLQAFADSSLGLEHFRAAPVTLSPCPALTFFRKYLTPQERADLMMVSMEAMTHGSRHDVREASGMLRVILTFSVPDVGKVPEITEYIYHNMDSIADAGAQETIKEVLHLLAQTYTDEVILTLFKIDDQSQRVWGSRPARPSGCVWSEAAWRQGPRVGDAGGDGPALLPLQAARALRELLLESGRRMEVQAFFPALFTALLFRIPLLMVEGATEAAQEQHHVTQRTDPVSSSVEALKTLMRSTGYSDHVSYVQRLGGWELLTRPERYHEGVALLARAMVVKDCWHICPVFSLTVRSLQERDQENHLTALVFITELLQSPVVAAIVDEVTVRTLASWFQCEELASVKLLLRAVEILARHEHMGKQLRALQPYVLNCCYSADGGIVAETLQVLRGLVKQLSWRHAAAFLIQLAFTLGPFLEEEAESLRLTAFEIYGALLAKLSRRFLVFPLRHQVLNLLVLLALHLEDVNVSVAQIARSALCRTATLIGWSKLKAIFAEKDVWTILRALAPLPSTAVSASQP
nr:maestro heat-like repeat-containing protein family member 7 [Kogia breviceps]